MGFKIADIFLETVLDWSKADAEAKKMDEKIGGISRGTVGTLSKGFGIAGAAVVGSLGMMAGKAAGFGDKMSNVATLGVKDLGALDKGTRDLAVRFGIDLTDAATSTYEVISAGIPEDAAIMVMESAAKGAQAGVGSLSDALDLGTSVMNAWDIKGKTAAETTASMEKIMGQAATAAQLGKTTFADMATSIGQVAPVMSAAGVSTDEFFAAVSAVTATGLPTSSAMRGLQQAVSNIIVPSERASKAAAELGLEFDAGALKSQGFAKFMENVKEKTGGNVETMGTLFGSVEALGAVISVTGNQSGIFADALGKMSKGQETLNTMSAAYVKDNPALAFKIAKESLNNLFILLGRSVIPAFVALSKVLTPVITAFTWLIEHLPTGVTATIGGLTLGVGFLLIALGSLGMALLGISSGMTALGIGATAAAAGTTTAGVAAGGAAIPFSALGASILAASIAALPWIVIAAALGAAAYVLIPSIIETKEAYDQLEASNKKTDAAFTAFEATLIRQGVALDAAALKDMSHAERSAVITQATIAHREAAMAAEIMQITGVEATKQQIHIAELARVGLEMSAKDAALAAVNGMTQAEIQGMMARGEATTSLLAVKQAAASSERELEIGGRTDRTATVGVFQWAANKEAEMMNLAKSLKTADFYERKQILARLGELGSQKAAAEQQWANENQALTARELSSFQYMTTEKESAEARFVATTEQNGMRQKENLYRNLSDEVATLKVHGDASIKRKEWEAEQKEKIAEQTAKVETDLGDKLGQDKLDALNKTLADMQENSGLQKASAEELSAFKGQILQGDLNTGIEYWGQMRTQTQGGLATSLSQYQTYSAAVQQEMAQLRQSVAYATNPAQTGSPSLNQEMALGQYQAETIIQAHVGRVQGQYAALRKDIMDTLVAQSVLVGTGMTSPGSKPQMSSVIGSAAASSPAPSGGAAVGGGGGGLNASITVAGNYNVPDKKVADALAQSIGVEVSRRLGDMVMREMRAKGIRRPGINFGGASMQTAT